MTPVFENSTNAIKGFIISSSASIIISSLLPVSAALILSVLILGFVSVGKEIYSYKNSPDDSFDSFYIVLGGMIPLLLILGMEVSIATHW